MIHFFHKLFNVHCARCEELEVLKNSKPRCLVCEELRELLNLEKREKQRLLDAILEFNHQNIKDKETAREVTPVSNLRPIPPLNVPWRVRQQMLEDEDRRRAQILAERQRDLPQTPTPVPAPTNEQLEEELGVSNG